MRTEAAIPNFTITGAMLAFAPSGPVEIANAGRERWLADLHRLGGLGFEAVDITDSWLRPGDLSSVRLGELRSVLQEAGLKAPAISSIRRSVLDPVDGDANLAYSHRTIEAASALGCLIVSVGLHRPLLPRQREALWFWTVDGPKDFQDRETYRRAANRLRELGQHGKTLVFRYRWNYTRIRYWELLSRPFASSRRLTIPMWVSIRTSATSYVNSD